LFARSAGKSCRELAALAEPYLPVQIPDIYDCIKYDVQHNRSVLEPGPAWDTAIQLYTYVKNLADVVIPQEYGMTKEEKLTIAQVRHWHG
jgi:inositol hexakisphosphate/diphosphoinositol-pentakisphosphate kinase